MLLVYWYYSYIYVHSFLNCLHIGCFTSCSYIIMFLWGIFSFVLVVGASKFYDFCMFLVYLPLFLHVFHSLTFPATRLFVHCHCLELFSSIAIVLPLLLLLFMVFSFLHFFFIIHFSFVFLMFVCFYIVCFVLFCMLTMFPLVALLQRFYSTYFICFSYI